MTIFWSVLGIFLALWAAMLGLAVYDRFATPEQMKSKGFDTGTPWVGHTAISMLDFFPLPWILAFWANQSYRQWNTQALIAAAVIGAILSGALHYQYVQEGKRHPDLVTYRGRLSPCGWVHLVYMGIGFALIALIYLFTPMGNATMLYLTSCYLFAHALLSMGIIQRATKPRWYPHHRVLSQDVIVTALGAAGGLTAATYLALHASPLTISVS